MSYVLCKLETTVVNYSIEHWEIYCFVADRGDNNGKTERLIINELLIKFDGAAWDSDDQGIYHHDVFTELKSFEYINSSKYLFLCETIFKDRPEKFYEFSMMFNRGDTK